MKPAHKNGQDKRSPVAGCPQENVRDLDSKYNGRRSPKAPKKIIWVTFSRRPRSIRRNSLHAQRRRPDSNRGIADLQSAPLATWVRRQYPLWDHRLIGNPNLTVKGNREAARVGCENSNSRSAGSFADVVHRSDESDRPGTRHLTQPLPRYVSTGG